MFPSIYKLVDNSDEYKLLSFMNTYSMYNQILVHETEKNNTVFMA